MTKDIKTNNLDKATNCQMIIQYLQHFTSNKCLFCHQSDEKFLLSCKDCGFYFCNNIHRKTSHIILHLNQCKHERICLSPFEQEIKCDNCTEKNIFNLKFWKSKQKLSILCEKCAGNKDFYRKIIDNKKINEEILPIPEEELPLRLDNDMMESTIQLLNNKINRLKDTHLPSVCLSFINKERYCRIFRDLLDEEMLTVETEDKLEPSYEYDLKFTKVGDSDYTAEITNPLQLKQNFLFYKRQLIFITKANNEEKGFTGKVINKENNKITIYCLDLKKHFADGPFNIKNKETIGSYERMKNGLAKFQSKKSYMNKDIEEIILGRFSDKFSNKNEYIKEKEIPTKLNILELGSLRLNESQEKAIFNCFKNKLTLIKGPPGTGKSTVLSILAYHLIKLKVSTHKILICAPSNRAVDNISLLLQKIKDIKFVRVLSPEKELSDDIDKTHCLYKLSKEEIYSKPEENKRIIELIKKREKYSHLKKSDNEEYRELMENIENKILNSCDIIISTINNSSDPRLENYFFQIVIIDEASQSLEPDLLLPLVHNAEMAVLIGDEKQLGPTVISRECDISGLNISLFERLCYYYEGSNFISLLNEQYRMPEFLYRFSNQFFYNNEVITKTKNMSDVISEFPWPDKRVLHFFIIIQD